MDFAQTVLAAAALTTGLSAGLFFAFAVAVMPGFARSSDRTFVEAMQNINVAILNGWFLVVFIGPLVLTVAAALLHLAGDGAVAAWSAVAFVLYATGVAITGRVNVPLNVALAASDLDDAGPARERFEAPWVRWHLIRTVAMVAAFGCLVAAALTA